MFKVPWLVVVPLFSRVQLKKLTVPVAPMVNAPPLLTVKEPEPGVRVPLLISEPPLLTVRALPFILVRVPPAGTVIVWPLGMVSTPPTVTVPAFQLKVPPGHATGLLNNPNVPPEFKFRVPSLVNVQKMFNVEPLFKWMVPPL